jgi:hypothetical protein
MPDLKRRRAAPAAGIIAALLLGGAILLAVVAHRAAGELIFLRSGRLGWKRPTDLPPLFADGSRTGEDKP